MTVQQDALRNVRDQNGVAVAQRVRRLDVAVDHARGVDGVDACSDLVTVADSKGHGKAVRPCIRFQVTIWQEVGGDVPEVAVEDDVGAARWRIPRVRSRSRLQSRDLTWMTARRGTADRALMNPLTWNEVSTLSRSRFFVVMVGF